jgi:hypothetical protein
MLGWVAFNDPIVAINPDKAERVAHKKDTKEEQPGAY